MSEWRKDELRIIKMFLSEDCPTDWDRIFVTPIWNWQQQCNMNCNIRITIFDPRNDFNYEMSRFSRAIPRRSNF